MSKQILQQALDVIRNQGDVSVDEWIAVERALVAALSQQGDPVTGWKLVPVEPTQAMVDAVKRAYPDNRFTRDSYRAMLAAAPAAQPDHTQQANEALRQAGNRSYEIAKAVLQHGIGADK